MIKLIATAVGFAILAGSAAAADAISDAPGIGPWTHPVIDGNAKPELRTFGQSADNTGITLRCSSGEAFGATWVNYDPAFSGRVVSVDAKVGSGPAMPLQPDQDQMLPGIVRLKNADNLERELLQKGGNVTLKIGIAGMPDQIHTYTFADLRPTANEIMKICPAF